MAGPSYRDRADPAEKAITHGVVAVLAGGGAGLVGWMLGWPWIIDMDDPDFNPLVLIAALLIAVFLWQVVLTLRRWFRRRRFGATEMEIDGPVPVPLGRALSGRLRSRQPLSPEGDYRIRLVCYDIHERGGSSDGTDKVEEFPVWSSDITLPAATDAVEGLRFRFDLPASVGPKPVSRIAAPNEYFSFKASINLPGFRRIVTRNAPPVGRRWQLTVTAPLPGTDFRADFTVPVRED